MENEEIKGQINGIFRQNVSEQLQETTINRLIEYLEMEHSAKDEIVNDILSILEDEIQ